MSTCSPDESPVMEEAESVIPSPNVIRTRSGRSLRTPAAGLESPSLKPNSRRGRKSTVMKPNDEVSTENAVVTPALESVCSDSVTSPSDPEGGNQAVVLCSDITWKSEPSCLRDNPFSTADTHGPTGAEKSNGERAHSQTCETGGRMVPLGKPKSGRVWKDRNKQRFSALLRDKPLRSSWQKKMEAKREKDIVKKYSQQLKDEKTREKEELKKRREENLRRRAENEKKAEIVQVIRNTAKLKRLKKKQLRKIEKRDTLPALQKTPPAIKKAGKGE